jgi:hypothetical protein
MTDDSFENGGYGLLMEELYILIIVYLYYIYNIYKLIIIE